MIVAAIILVHYKERLKNLKKIVKDLQMGSIAPDKIYVWNDNPELTVNHPGVICINSPQMPVSCRFALGMLTNSDYCFFIDDDMTVSRDTIQELTIYADMRPNAILGFEGNILTDGERPYTSGTSINAGETLIEVDVIIRSYYVPTKALPYLFLMKSKHGISDANADDICLCLGWKNEGHGEVWVIPSQETTKVLEIEDGGVGQCRSPEHYIKRDNVCKLIRSKY